ncbi:MAG: GNAT family N-acetyltransferase, partial [Niameybacter sp.]
IMKQIERATWQDVEEISNLYDELNDYLATHTNHAGWLKGVYPTQETAQVGIQNQELFVLRMEGKIVGTMILNHDQAEAYEEGRWRKVLKEEEVLVVHTLAIHPSYGGRGIATSLLNFAKLYSAEQGIKAIRLDVAIRNTPAQVLYEKCGYQEVGIVDLGLGIPELVWFKLYELLLS